MATYELTSVEKKKIEEEIAHRQLEVTPKCIAEVQRTRALGDLSENDEYRSARRDLNRNYSRIRYLQNMLDNAVIVDYKSDEDAIGLFDHVTLWNEEDEEESVITLTTPLRNDVLNGLISKESPLGAAIMGHKVGDKVEVKVNDKYSYVVEIRALEKGSDDASQTIN